MKVNDSHFPQVELEVLFVRFLNGSSALDPQSQALLYAGLMSTVVCTYHIGGAPNHNRAIGIEVFVCSSYRHASRSLFDKSRLVFISTCNVCVLSM